MKTKILAAAAIAVLGVAAGTSASAVTVQPDVLSIESNQNRGDGSAPGDIGNSDSFDFGLITGTAGIAGRIVNAIDTYTFETEFDFNVDFVNLLDLSGDDIDNCEGFDGSDCSDGSANNEDGRLAEFSLSDGVTTTSVFFTSSEPAGTSIFSNVAAGSYTLTIEGIRGPAGSAYDIAISAVPVPAGLPLLLSAFGVAGFVMRKKKS